ncbi:MAG: DUF4123 domain-containing protein [Pseudomonadales bacterium]
MDAFDYPQLLHCEAMRQGEDTQNRYLILVAAKVQDTLRLDEFVSQHLADKGYIFLYTEQSQSAQHYFERAGTYSAQAMSLCQSLNAQSPIVSQQVAVLRSVEQAQSSPNFVKFEAMDTPKALLQPGQAFWEREWINPQLKQALFSDNDHPDPERAVRTYLLVDATRYTQIRGVFDLDLIDDCSVKCMFTGDAAEGLKHVAPYLLDITLSAQALEDDNYVSHFHQRYFDTMWGEDIGVFIRTCAPMGKVHTHLRKFTKLQIDGQLNRFFRFWDPRVLKVFLPAVAEHYRVCGRFFQLPGFDSPSLEFLYEDHSVQPEATEGNLQRPILTKRAVFDSTAFAALQTQVRQGQIPPPEEPELHQIIETGFTQHKVRTFVEQTASWLIAHYGERRFAVAGETVSCADFLARQVPVLEEQYGVQSEYAMKSALEGCFLAGSGVEGMADKYLQILAFGESVIAQRCDDFTQAIISDLQNERVR